MLLQCGNAECQKKDWKIHKIVCHLIKRMPDTLLQYGHVWPVIKEELFIPEGDSVILVKLGSKRYFKLLQHTAAFAEHQFGKRIAGKADYQRENGNCLDNWIVEISILSSIYIKLGEHISAVDHTMKNSIPYYLKALAVFEPWIVQIDLSASERTDILDEQQTELLRDLQSKIEGNLSKAYGQVPDWDKAEYFRKQSIFHAKKMKAGEMRVKRVVNHLTHLSNIYYVSDK